MVIKVRKGELILGDGNKVLNDEQLAVAKKSTKDF